jgi:hypothetical protein
MIFVISPFAQYPSLLRFSNLIIIWGLIVVIDYRQVCHRFNKPIFAIGTKIEDDGGCGI